MCGDRGAMAVTTRGVGMGRPPVERPGHAVRRRPVRVPSAGSRMVSRRWPLRGERGMRRSDGDGDGNSASDGQNSVGAVRGPLLAFVRAESRSAVLLVVAILLALVWANVGVARYETVWSTDLALRLGPWQ